MAQQDFTVPEDVQPGLYNELFDHMLAIVRPAALANLIIAATLARDAGLIEQGQCESHAATMREDIDQSESMLGTMHAATIEQARKLQQQHIEHIREMQN